MRDYCCTELEDFRAETDNVILGLFSAGKATGTMTTTFGKQYTDKWVYCPFCGEEEK